MPLSCKDCGSRLFSLRPSAEGADAQCFDCGAIIPNSMLRGSKLDTFILPPASMAPMSSNETIAPCTTVT